MDESDGRFAVSILSDTYLRLENTSFQREIPKIKKTLVKQDEAADSPAAATTPFVGAAGTVGVKLQVPHHKQSRLPSLDH